MQVAIDMTKPNVATVVNKYFKLGYTVNTQIGNLIILSKTRKK